MPKGSSGADSIGVGANQNVSISNETLASRETMQAAARVLTEIMKEYPDLQPYLNLMQFSEADIKGAAGVYQYGLTDNSNDRIIIDRGVLNRPGTNVRGEVVSTTLQGVTAHEIGHALSEKSQASFKSVRSAVRTAYKQYNRSRSRSDRVSEGAFARSISNYANKGYSETFAEAFADVHINRGNAAEASRLIMRYWRKRR